MTRFSYADTLRGVLPVGPMIDRRRHLMIRLLAILIVLYVAGTFAYRFFLPEPVAFTSTQSPEQQFQAIVASGSATAEQLGALCDTYPQLAARYLKNGTPLRVQGTVRDLRVAGLDGRRAGVTLYQGTKRPLIAVFDLDHYAVLGLEPVWDHRVHYLVVGNELLKITPPGIYHRGTERIEIHTEVRSLVFTRATPFEETLTLTAINPGAILFAANAK